MKIVVGKAVVTDLFVSEKSGSHFITLKEKGENGGQFKLSAPAGTLSGYELEAVEPFALEAVVSPRIYNKTDRDGRTIEQLELKVLQAKFQPAK